MRADDVAKAIATSATAATVSPTPCVPPKRDTIMKKTKSISTTSIIGVRLMRRLGRRAGRSIFMAHPVTHYSS